MSPAYWTGSTEKESNCSQLQAKSGMRDVKMIDAGEGRNLAGRIILYPLPDFWHMILRHAKRRPAYLTSSLWNRIDFPTITGANRSDSTSCGCQAG